MIRTTRRRTVFVGFATTGRTALRSPSRFVGNLFRRTLRTRRTKILCFLVAIALVQRELPSLQLSGIVVVVVQTGASRARHFAIAVALLMTNRQRAVNSAAQNLPLFALAIVFAGNQLRWTVVNDADDLRGLFADGVRCLQVGVAERPQTAEVDVVVDDPDAGRWVKSSQVIIGAGIEAGIRTHLDLAATFGRCLSPEDFDFFFFDFFLPPSFDSVTSLDRYFFKYSFWLILVAISACGGETRATICLRLVDIKNVKRVELSNENAVTNAADFGVFNGMYSMGMNWWDFWIAYIWILNSLLSRFYH